MLGKASANLVEAVPERIDHVRYPCAPPLQSAQVGDGVETLGATLILFEGLCRTLSTHGVIAWQHDGVVEEAARQLAHNNKR